MGQFGVAVSRPRPGKEAQLRERPFSLLVRAALDWAAAQGVREARVRCNVVCVVAHRFYAQMGFVEAKRQVVFTRDVASDSRGG